MKFKGAWVALASVLLMARGGVAQEVTDKDIATAVNVIEAAGLEVVDPVQAQALIHQLEDASTCEEVKAFCSNKYANLKARCEECYMKLSSENSRFTQCTYRWNSGPPDQCEKTGGESPPCPSFGSNSDGVWTAVCVKPKQRTGGAQPSAENASSAW